MDNTEVRQVIPGEVTKKKKKHWHNIPKTWKGAGKIFQINHNNLRVRNIKEDNTLANTINSVETLVNDIENSISTSESLFYQENCKAKIF